MQGEAMFSYMYVPGIASFSTSIWERPAYITGLVGTYILTVN